jgi:hypothetical protein
MEESSKTIAPATFFSDLAAGIAYPFSERPNSEVPTFAAGVYTVWHRDGRFIYVGMSGRGMTAYTVDRKKPQGNLYTSEKPRHWTPQRRVSSAFTWRTDLSSRPSRKRTLRQSPQDAINWMLLFAGTFTKTFRTDL